MKRVVVTGMGGITALGDNWQSIETKLRTYRNAVRYMPEWDYIQSLNTRIGVPIDDFAIPEHYPRKMIRSMGRVALLSVRASELALADAGLLNDVSIQDGRMGVAYGSSSGSVDPVRVFAEMLTTGSMENVSST
ncbi:MAG TPA: beta-ketoacyl synthase N-terminal-like domain-containing protein, partial [Methyloradius sp.]